jgi:hypothetical protein
VTRDVELVAHRAGNSVVDAAGSWPHADALELDVHLFRGRLEVRHAKVLWPLAVRWDRWEVLSRSSPRPILDDILTTIDPDVHLWLDLKGFDRRLTSRVLAKICDRPRSTVSSRSWWLLDGVSAPDETIRVVHSIGNRAQLRARLSGQASPVEAVAISQRLADQRTIAALRRAASATFVWGVGDVARALDLVRSGADGLIVDGADILAEIRSRLTSHPEGAAPAPASVSVTRRPTALSHSAR